MLKSNLTAHVQHFSGLLITQSTLQQFNHSHTFTHKQKSSGSVRHADRTSLGSNHQLFLAAVAKCLLLGVLLGLCKYIESDLDLLYL